jgi:hypothetical protein
VEGIIMKRICAGALLCLALSTYTFAQFSTVGGTVSDATGALIPGVQVTATNTQTGVVTTVITNETGTYNIPGLQPGIYNVAAELSGFQKLVRNNVELGSNQQVRLNFTLQVGGVSTAVEVTVATDSLLAASSASVGSVLPENTITSLPDVGRDALSLINVLAGVRAGTGGPAGIAGAEGGYSTARASATFAGIYAGYGAVNTTRDGVSVQNNRRTTGVNSNATINQDLVDEVRVIVAPVDAENSGGVGQVQILTRSGTNMYRGTAVFNVLNSAFNASPWNSNRIGVTPLWYNRPQWTVSYGGPIIKNKTFFFALLDGQRMHSRSNVQTPVLTSLARQGQFRFFPGVVNGNAESQVTFGANPQAPVVDLAGNPVKPAAATGDLQTVSVFGRDSFRPGFDPTGFINKYLGGMPLPNDFRGGDGLNIANFNWVRRGDSIVGAQFNTEDDTNRDQINIKVDHHFNTRHKLQMSYVQENNVATANPSPWPTGWFDISTRRPHELTGSIVSTLSPTIVNEFRAGLHIFYNERQGPCLQPGVKDDLKSWLPNVQGYTLRVNVTTFAEGRLNGGCNSTQGQDNSYSYSDSISWTHRQHSFKAGFQDVLNGSDVYSSVNWFPVATGGAGNFPVTGIETANIPGMLGNNLTNARNLLLTLAGSVSNIQQSFRMATPSAATFVDLKEYGPTPPKRFMAANQWNVFFKDDWKVTPSVTLNLGVRYDFIGVPFEKRGFAATLVGGGLAGFGWSGRSWSDYWTPGPQKAPLSQVQFVGPHSTNPGAKLWQNDWNNVGPAVGFSWSLPWFGKDKTTVRGGYAVNYMGHIGQLIDLDAQAGTSVPGTSDSETVTSTSYLDLTNINFPLPRRKPLDTIPLTDRTQSITVFDPKSVSPYVQTFNLSVTRTLRRNVTVDVRYIGSKGTKLYGQIALNQPNFLTNGLLDALNVTRAGGDAPLFDQMLKGLNINPGVAGFGAVGTTVNGVPQTGSAALRQNTTYRTNIANGNYTAVVGSLNTSTAVTGQGGGFLRNGGFPENFIVNNPQFNGVTMVGNPGSSIYHSMQAQLTFRPTAGLTSQASYTFSKAMSACQNSTCTAWTNPVQRSLDRSLQSSDRRHDFKLVGSYELPFGPNRLFLGKSSGILARLVEQWQVGWITGLLSGAPLSLSATNNYIGNTRPDIVGNFPKNQGSAQMTANLPVYFATGTYKIVSDPQCNSVTPLQGTQIACTLTAIADSQGRIVVQHSRPGTLGNLGANWLTGPGTFTFDLSAGKKVRLTETKALQLRVDAHNVLNHPILGSPNLNIDASNFGQMNGTDVLGNRVIQGQLRLTF